MNTVVHGILDLRLFALTLDWHVCIRFWMEMMMINHGKAILFFLLSTFNDTSNRQFWLNEKGMFNCLHLIKLKRFGIEEKEKIKISSNCEKWILIFTTTKWKRETFFSKWYIHRFHLGPWHLGKIYYVACLEWHLNFLENFEHWEESVYREISSDVCVFSVLLFFLFSSWNRSSK